MERQESDQGSSTVTKPFCLCCGDELKSGDIRILNSPSFRHVIPVLTSVLQRIHCTDEKIHALVNGGYGRVSRSCYALLNRLYEADAKLMNIAKGVLNKIDQIDQIDSPSCAVQSRRKRQCSSDSVDAPVCKTPRLCSSMTVS